MPLKGFDAVWIVSLWFNTWWWRRVFGEKTSPWLQRAVSMHRCSFKRWRLARFRLRRGFGAQGGEANPGSLIHLWRIYLRLVGFTVSVGKYIIHEWYRYGQSGGIEDQETRWNVKDDDLEIQNDQKSDVSALDMGEGIAQIARNDTKLKPQNRTDWQQLPPKAQPKRLVFALQMHLSWWRLKKQCWPTHYFRWQTTEWNEWMKE